MEYRVLGPLEVVTHGHVLDVGPWRQRALLALLLVRRGETLTTERLTDLLWDDRPPGRAANNIQSYVSRLRRVLHDGSGRPVLLTRARGYVLDVPAGDVDAERFVTLADAGGEALSAGDPATARRLLVEALALWRGDAYADFAGERFVRDEVMRLHEVRLRAIEDRFDAELALGHHAAAAAEVGVLVEQHPLRERLRELLMLALYRSGRHVEALEAYRRGREQLAQELGVDPGPVLQRLEQAILCHDEELLRGPGTPVPRTAETAVRPHPGTPSSSAPGPASAIVGRDAEVGILRTALAAMLTGLGRVVLLAGEPGVGKTRLGEELAAAAVQEGADVRWGYCFEGGGAPAFWPWAQILRAVVEDLDEAGLGQAVGGGGAELAQLVPELGQRLPQLASPPRTEGEEDRFRRYDTVVRFLRRVALRRPTVVVLEDIHWADIPSLHLLQLLAVHAADVPLLVLVTYRDTAPDDAPHLRAAVAELTRQRIVQRLDVGGLDAAAVRALAEDRLGAPLDDGTVDVLQERTGGNPFFLAELLRFLADSGNGDGAEEVLRTFVPTGVRDVILRRLATLPDGTRAALDAAAVVGRDFDVSVLAAVLSASPGDVLDRLEPAVAARVVARVGESAHRYRFRHALLRETIDRALPAARGTRLHAEVADALHALRRGSRAEIAHHYACAAPVGYVEQAIDAALAAADEARALLAFEPAEQHLRGALELLDQYAVAPDRELAVHTRLIDLVTMLRGYTAPEILGAVERARRACATSERPEAGALLWGAWSGSCVLGDFATAAALASELSAHARRTAVSGELSIAGIACGVTAWHLGRLDEAGDTLEEALGHADAASRESERWSRPQPAVVARCFLADVRYLQGRPDDADRLAGEAVERAERGGVPYERCFVRVVPLALGADDGRGGDVLEAVTAAVQLAERHGFRQLAALARIRAGWALVHAAEPVGAVAQIEEGLARFRLTGAGMLRPLFLGWLAYAMEKAGRGDDALRIVDEAVAAAGVTGEGLFVPELHRLKGQILAARGEPSAPRWLRLAHSTAQAQGAVLFARRAQDAITRVTGIPVQRGARGVEQPT